MGKSCVVHTRVRGRVYFACPLGICSVFVCTSQVRSASAAYRARLRQMELLGAALDALWGGAPIAKPCKPDEHEARFVEELQAALASTTEGQSSSRDDLV